MSKKLLRLISLMGVLAALGVSAFLVGAQAQSPLQLHGDNVVKVEQPAEVPLDDVSRSVNQGTKETDGSCTFTTYMEKGPNEPARLSRTVSVDYDTCEAIIEEGNVRPEDLGRLVARAAPQPAGSFNSQQGPIYRTRYKTWYEDLANWTLNGVKSTVRWTVDSSKVWRYSSDCHHWKAVGWKDGGGTCTDEYLGNQARLEKDTTRTFTNGVFPCPIPGSPTKVRYYENVAGGKVNGNSYGQSVSNSSGRCGSWLHSHRLLY